MAASSIAIPSQRCETASKTSPTASSALGVRLPRLFGSFSCSYIKLLPRHHTTATTPTRSASFGRSRLRMLGRIEDPVEPRPILSKLVLSLSDKFLRARITQQVGQFGQLAVGLRQLVPAGRIHQPNAGFDAALEPVAAAEILGIVEGQIAGFF